MAFNKGYELKKFEAHWEKLRIEYAEAGMADDAMGSRCLPATLTADTAVQSWN